MRKVSGGAAPSKLTRPVMVEAVAGSTLPGGVTAAGESAPPPQPASETVSARVSARPRTRDRTRDIRSLWHPHGLDRALLLPLKSEVRYPSVCRYRLGVRTRGSQPRDRGANPRTGTNSPPASYQRRTLGIPAAQPGVCPRR